MAKGFSSLGFLRQLAAEKEKDYVQEEDRLTGHAYGTMKNYDHGYLRDGVVALLIQQYYDEDGTFYPEGRGDGLDEVLWRVPGVTWESPRGTMIHHDDKTILSMADGFNKGLAKRLSWAVEDSLKGKSYEKQDIALSTALELRGKGLMDKFGGLVIRASEAGADRYPPDSIWHTPDTPPGSITNYPQVETLTEKIKATMNPEQKKLFEQLEEIIKQLSAASVEAAGGSALSTAPAAASTVPQKGAEASSCTGCGGP